MTLEGVLKARPPVAACVLRRGVIIVHRRVVAAGMFLVRVD